MVTEREQQAQLGLRLLAKVRDYQDNPFYASTLDDVKQYRKMLVTKGNLTEEEQQDVRLLAQWIYDNTNLYEPNDDGDHMKFAIGFDEDMLKIIIEKVAPDIKHAYQWVCLYHSLIGFHFIKEMKWTKWAKALNGYMADLGLAPAFESDQNISSVPEYFTMSRMWKFDEYLKSIKAESARAKTEARNKFDKMVTLLNLIKSILFEVPMTPPKTGTKLSA